MPKMMKLVLVLGLAVSLVRAAMVVPASEQPIDRTQLLVPDAQYKYLGKIPSDARDAWVHWQPARSSSPAYLEVRSLVYSLAPRCQRIT